MSNIERDYWNQRYDRGMNSGWCSVGKLKEWRWKIIKKHMKIKDKSVLDVGCGDLRFWDGVKHTDYTGIDISSVIIEKNFSIKPEWKFICEDVSEAILNESYDIVFCFEMLFHIMSEVSFIRILQNLNTWAGEMLFISCWNQRPEPFVYPHYQAHYQLEDYLKFLPDLVLKKKYKTDLGQRALYVFSRKAVKE